MGEKRGRLRRAISTWASTEELEDRDLREEHGDAQVCIADAPDRRTVVLDGTLRTVTLRPRGGVPALEADLDDGTGTLTIVWLGRRRIAGVSPGRSIRVTGRIGVQDGHRVVYNPRYELKP